MDCKNEGTKVFVFPEGTRNHYPEKKEMLPFKTGAFAAAIGAQVRGRRSYCFELTLTHDTKKARMKQTP